MKSSKRVDLKLFIDVTDMLVKQNMLFCLLYLIFSNDTDLYIFFPFFFIEIKLCYIFVGF